MTVSISSRTGFLTGVLLLLGSVSLPAAAQDERPSPPGTVLKKIVPNPTGKNGYEELILAGEYLQASPARKLVEQSELPLSQRRRALGDSRVVKALTLLRQGLQKPVSEPRSSLSLKTELPELSLFRGLGRLVALQETTYLADGRVRDALQSLRVGLRLGRSVQTTTLISGLVGVAITTSVIQPIGLHLDQLSAPDCAELFRVCTDELQAPDPGLRIIEQELRVSRGIFREIRDEVKKRGTQEAIKELGLSAGEAGPFLARAPTTPEGVDMLVAQAEERYVQFSREIVRSMSAPPWERRMPPLPAGDDLATTFARMLIPAYERVGVAYQKDAARFRLLACHAAVLNYRWEHSRPPMRLEELNLGELILDPFTGKPFEYQQLGRQYRLMSVGEEAPNDEKAVNGRLPLGVTPDE